MNFLTAELVRVSSDSSLVALTLGELDEGAVLQLC